MRLPRLSAIGAVVGLAALAVTAVPGQAHAWWRGGWGVGVWVPPVVVGPVPFYVPPPVYYGPPPAAYYYGPPRPVWVPPHWQGNYWVGGHWA
jgi:hypothetical protein